MCLSSLTIQTLCVTLSLAAQHFPSWGHYDLCKTRLYWDQGMSWDYMACQPEANLLTRFLKIKLDPPNSTCGDSPEMYCTLENPYMCNNECDARTPELAHPPELMLDDEGRIPNTFWQSVSWRNFPQPLLVNITLSWGKSIELTEDIVITFESGRPEQMVLEKSLDHGRTWQPYQFYAADCLNSFGMEARRAQDLSQASVLDIICTEQYSRGYVWKVDKMVRFEIQERLSQFGGPRLSDMASLYGQLDTIKELRDFFSLTDLRLRLLRPATGPTSVDPLNLSKYFYAISNLDIRGRMSEQKHNQKLSCRLCFEKCVCVQGEACERCKCNLHANNCIVKKDRLSCVCEHNTTGPDCGRCRKGYQGRRWRAGSYLPIPKGTANVCLPDTVTSGSGVCDNLLTRCQNGGVCEDNGTCRCPALYTGLLCEKVQCGKEAGGCTSRSPRVPTLPRLLLSLTALFIAAEGCPLL